MDEEIEIMMNWEKNDYYSLKKIVIIVWYEEFFYFCNQQD